MTITYQIVVNHHEDGLIDIMVTDVDHDIDSQKAVALALRDIAHRLENGGIKPMTMQ